MIEIRLYTVSTGEFPFVWGLSSFKSNGDLTNQIRAGGDEAERSDEAEFASFVQHWTILLGVRNLFLNVSRHSEPVHDMAP